MRAPDASSRTVVVGSTGSGKTQFSVWYLNKMISGPWADMPVTIFNPKRARLIGELPATPIDLYKKPPKKPGLYVVTPRPDEDNEATVEYLKQVYENTHHGLYFDEVLELGQRNKGFRRLLTQGRELQIPMIYCMQRPSWCDQYSFSEAEFWAIFRLNKIDDVQKVTREVNSYDKKKLGAYQCYWYDAASDEGVILPPVPRASQIVAEYEGERSSNVVALRHEDGEEDKRRMTFL